MTSEIRQAPADKNLKTFARRPSPKTPWARKTKFPRKLQAIPRLHDRFMLALLVLNNSHNYLCDSIL